MGFRKAQILVCFSLENVFASEPITEVFTSKSAKEFMSDFAHLRKRMLNDTKLTHFTVNKKTCNVDCFLYIDEKPTTEEGYLFLKMINGSINCIIHFYGELKTEDIIKSIEDGTFIGISGFEPVYSGRRLIVFIRMLTSDFKRIFLPMSKLLYRRAFRLTANVQDAEDLVQETFLRLWRRHDTLENVNNPEGLACEILKNAAIDLLRTRHIHSELTLEHEPEDNYSTVHETEVCDALILANKLIKQLKPQQQRILTLRSREECEMAEIANLTGETEDNVRAILSRSRKKLKEMFLKKMNHGL